MIIVSATLDFATEADRDRAVTLTTSVQLATRTEEAGCHAYCFAADPAVPTRIQVYELWEDEGSLVAHFKHANYEAMKDALGGVGIVGTEIRCTRSGATNRFTTRRECRAKRSSTIRLPPRLLEASLRLL